MDIRVHALWLCVPYLSDLGPLDVWGGCVGRVGSHINNSPFQLSRLVLCYAHSYILPVCYLSGPSYVCCLSGLSLHAFTSNVHVARTCMYMYVYFHCVIDSYHTS